MTCVKAGSRSLAKALHFDVSQIYSPTTNRIHFILQDSRVLIG